jgi:hypothetical protein
MRLWRRKRRIEWTESSGNVFADLALPDAEELQEKAAACRTIRRDLRAVGIDPNLLCWALRGELSRASLMDFAMLRTDVHMLSVLFEQATAEGDRA